MMNALYFDHAATTPLDPTALEEMLPWLQGGRPGNASSLHSFGQAARRAIDIARERVAKLIGAHADEVVFTSGGTESNNLAILGGAAAHSWNRQRLITTNIEHQAVLNPCRHLAHSGRKLTLLPVENRGVISPEKFAAHLGQDVVLASIMLANNDIGTIQPVEALAPSARRFGVLIHCDAVQAVGKIAVDVKQLGVDLLSLSAHKICGPQGIGALYVRRGTPLAPLGFGGKQERGLRPGTENVAAIVGLGKACDLAAQRMEDDAAHMTALRASFEEQIQSRISGACVNAGESPRLPSISSISFPGIDGEMMVINLDLLGVAASTGAACSSGYQEPSHVLRALGHSSEEARSSVRFSFGRNNTVEEVSRLVEAVVGAAEGMTGYGAGETE